MGLRTSRLLARSGRAPLVVPIEAASFCDLDDIAVLGSLHGSRRRAVHGEGAVAAPAMVVLEVIDKESPQVPLAENDDVVQALAADGSDDSLRVRVLSGTPRGGEYFLDPNALDAHLERWPVHAVAISNQKARRRLPGKRLGQLLGGPLRR